MKEVFGTGAIARICGVSPRTAAAFIDSGRLKGWRIPGCRARRTSRDLLAKFLRDNGMPGNHELKPAEPDAPPEGGTTNAAA